jgi:hydroxyacylglutathione hydrolase
MALYIKPLIYNAFQVNTYLIYDDAGNGIVVDPACYTSREQEHLTREIAQLGLTVRYVVNTHSHVDHVLGTGFMYRSYGLKPLIHQAGLPFYDHLSEYAYSFGFELDELVIPEEFLEDGDELILGEERMKVLYTPGHADGSICLAHDAGKWIVTGDLLFQLSIGRTDLPTGSLEVLLKSVREKILMYDDEYTIYPGHGPATAVGFERKNNPFL